MSDERTSRIVIVGGGAAGWITAGVLAADHCAAQPGGLSVTVVESPNVPIIGVGEGTWPSLRDTLRRMGVSETELIRRCNASFKQGSRFDGWRTGRSDDFYFHPFDAAMDPDRLDPLFLWSQTPEAARFDEAVSVQPALCLLDKAPKQAATPEFAAVANYAYHFDAPAFAAMLREHCVNRLGVKLVEDDVVKCRKTESGDIAAVATREHGDISGDLFVDCTGLRALLIGDEMSADVTDASRFLFNDGALAIQVPYESDAAPIASQTIGSATPVGWIWDIGLQTRRGVGHVFSSAHADEKTARSALGDYLARTAPHAKISSEDARLIRFRSEYRETPWRGNVVAVGMSQGFVEPLEASAIVMIELSARMISDTLPPSRDQMARAAARFNNRFAYRWGRIVDFLKLHYVLSAREEPYWRDHRDPASIPDRLAALLDQWRIEPPTREDFPDAVEIFTAPSYAYVLYGMGVRPPVSGAVRRNRSMETARQIRDGLAMQKQKFLAGLPDNRALIAHAIAVGLPRAG